MAGYAPIALSLSASPLPAPELFPAVLNFLADAYGLDRQFESAISRLKFDPRSGELVDVVTMDPRPLADLITEARWIRLDGEIQLGRFKHFAEIYLHPVSLQDQHACISVKLPATALQALYGFSSTVGAPQDEAAKKGLVGLCLGIAAKAEVDCLLLHFDDGSLKALDVKEILRCLRLPELTLHGRRPGLLTGARETLISLKELISVWKSGKHVYQTIAGYVVLDLLEPIED